MILMALSKQFFRMFFSLPALLLLFVFAGCGGKGGGDAMKQQQPELPVMKVSQSDAVVTSSYATMLEGRSDVEIRPQVDGILRGIFVKEGAFVNAGQSLFAIDDRVYREQYNSAVAAEHAAEADLAVARLDAEKLVPLVKNKVVSDIQLRTARAKYQAAKASFEQARAAARSAAVSLDYAVIKAPVSGYVGKIPFRLGTLVSKNQDDWLTLLSDVSKVYASFSMSELEFIRFRDRYEGGSIEEKLSHIPPVSLVMADGRLFSEKGVLETVSGQFDKTTGSLRMRAVFPNPGGMLRSGNTGKVQLESFYRNAVLVPQAATVGLQDKVYVFVLGKGNAVRKRLITISGASDASFIVRSGLRPGAVIVTAGIDKLQDGAVIRPVGKTAAPSGGRE
jgi:membrane fusion protein (multidrug efflux system)